MSPPPGRAARRTLPEPLGAVLIPGPTAERGGRPSGNRGLPVQASPHLTVSATWRTVTLWADSSPPILRPNQNNGLFGGERKIQLLMSSSFNTFEQGNGPSTWFPLWGNLTVCPARWVGAGTCFSAEPSFRKRHCRAASQLVDPASVTDGLAHLTAFTLADVWWARAPDRVAGRRAGRQCAAVTVGLGGTVAAPAPPACSVAHAGGTRGPARTGLCLFHRGDEASAC